MIAFLNKFFVDKFFILYFYISSSVTYDFYITIFLNLIAIFYFLLMLYVLNFIAFLRNNFFNDLRVTKLIGYLLGLSLKHDPERFKQIMGALAYYGYTVLTVLEVRSEEHTSELQSRPHLVCRLLLEKKNDSLDHIDTVVVIAGECELNGQLLVLASRVSVQVDVVHLQTHNESDGSSDIAPAAKASVE